MPKKNKPKSTEPQVIPVGTFCVLKRPNLWAGFDCLIAGYENGFYVARVTRVEGTSFEILAKVDELQLRNTK